jgi:hypothetical protein
MSVTPLLGPSIRRPALAVAKAVCIVAAATTAPAAPAKSPRPPRFVDYPVPTIYRGPVKPLHLVDPSQYAGSAEGRCVGEEPLPGYKPGPVNFAGHLVIETCTCGSGCHSLYLWDAVTGRFFGFFPSRPIDVGPYGIGLTAPPVEYKGEEYKADSSLLILEGCIEDTCDCARRYYNWTGSQFKLIFTEPTRMPPACENQKSR